MTFITDPAGINLFSFLALKGALHLETLGLGRRGRSACTIAKGRLKTEGQPTTAGKGPHKVRVLTALEDYIEGPLAWDLEDRRKTPRKAER